MNPYVLCFQEIDKTKLALVGGKGANLGELSRIEGIQVPEGFCVTTEAYQEIVGKNEEIQSLLDRLSLLKASIMRLLVTLNTLVKTMRMPYVPALQRRIFQQPLSRDSRIRI